MSSPASSSDSAAAPAPAGGYRLLPFDREDRGEQLAALLGIAFNFPPEDAPEWWDRAGDEQLRVLEDADGRVAGTVLYIPMGHFLGGRPVRCCGIAGVAVA